MKQLVIAEPAARDIEGIVDYIALDNPGAAENVYWGTVSATEKLPEFPALGRPGRHPETRELSIADLPYLIVYEVDPALLHKSADGRTAPIPGQSYPTTFVTGMPSSVKPFRTATRTWNSAT